MEEDTSLLPLLEETENLMNDILLSGFHSVQASTLDKWREIGEIYDKLGMEEGKKIISTLEKELHKRRNSFEYDISKITKLFCTLEFYLKNAKNRLE